MIPYSLPALMVLPILGALIVQAKIMPNSLAHQAALTYPRGVEGHPQGAHNQQLPPPAHGTTPQEHVTPRHERGVSPLSSNWISPMTSFPPFLKTLIYSVAFGLDHMPYIYGLLGVREGDTRVFSQDPLFFLESIRGLFPNHLTVPFSLSQAISRSNVPQSHRDPETTKLSIMLHLIALHSWARTQQLIRSYRRDLRPFSPLPRSRSRHGVGATWRSRTESLIFPHVFNQDLSITFPFVLFDNCRYDLIEFHGNDLYAGHSISHILKRVSSISSVAHDSKMWADIGNVYRKNDIFADYSFITEDHFDAYAEKWETSIIQAQAILEALLPMVKDRIPPKVQSSVNMEMPGFLNGLVDSLKSDIHEMIITTKGKVLDRLQVSATRLPKMKRKVQALHDRACQRASLFYNLIRLYLHRPNLTHLPSPTYRTREKVWKAISIDKLSDIFNIYPKGKLGVSASKIYLALEEVRESLVADLTVEKSFNKGAKALGDELMQGMVDPESRDPVSSVWRHLQRTSLPITTSSTFALTLTGFLHHVSEIFRMVKGYRQSGSEFMENIPNFLELLISIGGEMEELQIWLDRGLIPSKAIHSLVQKIQEHGNSPTENHIPSIFLSKAMEEIYTALRMLQDFPAKR
ncbi:hypothetical protein BJ684DRAFT_18998 [Piptocephalis cylindrospora]|uniref:Uncharacterized protein n=1 Tax=Piptocephalis cylindrospora TaxID=1907219 RepID=A0A4P9Y6L0_9FUNG|nr:hypothetical protein BJ684DRAFT_18998 [Piptocephalis cylindrospora]|eukprot:RKP14603.1 hypothetical protein BJ684DRAFT_18998 [Piptocephalis cylindrospora]